MSTYEKPSRKLGVEEINLSDMAEHLDSDDRQQVAERAAGDVSIPAVSPTEYLALTEGYGSENSRVSQRREEMRNIIEEERSSDGIRFPYSGEISEEDVLETLERYEQADADPYELDFDDYKVFMGIKQKASTPHPLNENNEWYEKLSLKEFSGFGTFEYLDSGACRTVYRGPVGKEEDKVIYVPDETKTPDAYDDEFRNRMAQMAAALQNKKVLDESNINAEFVSETFEPAVVNLHGEPVPVILADYREMKNIPDERLDQAHEVAEELDEKSEEEDLIYHDTGTGDSNSEFIVDGGIRRDNLKYDSGTGELVVADAGELNSDLDREEIEDLLAQEMVEAINSQRQRIV